MWRITLTIFPTTQITQEDLTELKSELTAIVRKTVKDVLNEVMDGSAFKPASTSEPALVTSSQKPTTQSEGSKTGT